MWVKVRRDEVSLEVLTQTLGGVGCKSGSMLPKSQSKMGNNRDQLDNSQNPDFKKAIPRVSRIFCD